MDDIREKLGDPDWRLNNLYKIIIKGNDADDDLVITFKMNRAQRKFMSELHHRNIILKARQLGFTTLIAIVWLDHALFNSNSRCGIIAHDRDAAEIILRDKVKFAYNNLPPSVRAAMPLTKESASEVMFANNSSVRVATSMRSGTIHRLHISEFGKICAKYPDKAREVTTGSIPAVPQTGIVVVESTAEGPEGEFYEMTQRAIATNDLGLPLNSRDYQFHFFPWFDAPEYRMPAGSVPISEKDKDYFDAVEATMARTIDDEQRTWYVATRDSDFSGNDELMWQEYPSTPTEAFQKSTEGRYYVKELAAVRKSGRILNIPQLGDPVNTFWDIGNSDGSAIWFHQRVGMEHRFIRYYEAHGEDLRHYIKYLQDTGYIWGTHYLPHDADHTRLGEVNKSIKQQLEALAPTMRFEIVPRISDINSGIQLTRQYFPMAYFDAEGCKEGIIRLDNYKRKFNRVQGRFSGDPEKNDGNSEAADAFRQWAQALDGSLIGNYSAAPRRRTSGSWRVT
jgi:hypothetical protein